MWGSRTLAQRSKEHVTGWSVTVSHFAGLVLADQIYWFAQTVFISK
jgi:hypothetical protein